MIRIIKFREIHQIISRQMVERVGYNMSKFDCKNCAKKIEVPQCNACHKMYVPFFVNRPEKYKVDREEIKNMARDLQKQFHPDKCGEESQLKEKMEKYSSYINQAKATLLNDLQRAIYLMGLKGVEVSEQIEVEGGSFMEQLFELQMEIQSANLPQAESIKKRIQTVLEQVQKELQLFFTSEDLNKCKQFVIKYKYLTTALTNVKQRITSLQQ